MQSPWFEETDFQGGRLTEGAMSSELCLKKQLSVCFVLVDEDFWKCALPENWLHANNNNNIAVIKKGSRLIR